MKNSPLTTTEPTVYLNHTDQRYIFNGTFKKATDNETRRSNRPVKPRKRSLFSIITILLAASILITFYVWNKICVKDLIEEKTLIERKLELIKLNNNDLVSEISKRTSLEKIDFLINSGRLDLIFPKEKAETFSIDEERMKKILESTK